MQTSDIHHWSVKIISKFQNISFLQKKFLSFLDFNIATKLYRKDTFRKFGIPPNDVFEDNRRLALEDWSSFIYAVCMHIGVEYKWFDRRAECKLHNKDVNKCSNLENAVSTYYSNM